MTLQLHPRRAADISAYVALIESTLAQSQDHLPGHAARSLIVRLEAAEVAHVRFLGGNQIEVIILMVKGCGESVEGALRDWTHNAKDRLAGKVAA